MRVMVTGGAGYIGSHMVKMLIEHEVDVVVFDNLSSGNTTIASDVPLVQADINNRSDVVRALKEHRVDAVMHFASLIQVGESICKPQDYYQTNLCGTLNLLSAMRETNVQRLIFSSTAAIFGEPRYTPLDEEHPTEPINPYGFSKLAAERALADFYRAYDISSVSLRYFNAAGAHPSGEIGECHHPETHLIPLVLKVALSRDAYITVFGSDYPTPDGTCIRDYVHVVDLCRAHLLALEYIKRESGSFAYNLGNQTGFSVKQIIQTAERITGKKIPIKAGPRRKGDPAILIADSAKAIDELGWRPIYQDIDTILSHAWAWERKRVSFKEERRQ
jgi:UDP-glucose 4-epimerase